MHKLFYLLCLVGFLACSNPKKVTAQPSAYERLIERTDRIELVSLHPEQLESEIYGDDNKVFSSAITAEGVNVQRFDERIMLDKKWWKYLGSRLIKDYDDGMVAECYNPRNGIAYYSKDEIIGYLEICFECDQLRFAGSFPPLENQPSELFHSLKRFFEKQGISRTE